MMVGKMPSGDLTAKERLETRGWLAAIASEKERKEAESKLQKKGRVLRKEL